MTIGRCSVNRIGPDKNRWIMYRNAALLSACLLTAWVEGVYAEPNFNVNGFFSAGVTRSNSEAIYRGNIEDNINYGTDTILGLQIQAVITDPLSLTGQFVAKEDERGNFDVDADWAYFKYRFNDTVALRGGRLRLPTYLASDYIEVGFAYPWIRPPVEVYGQASLLNYTGADLLLNKEVRGMDLQIQPYTGNVRDEGVDGGQIKGDEVVGFNASLTGDIGSVRAGVLRAKVTVDNPFFGVIADNMQATFYSAGATLDWHNLVGYAEYGKSVFDTTTVIQAQQFPDVAGWYVTLGYRLNRLLPHITYASSDNEDLRARKQNSITMGFRYDVNSFAALKVEYQRVDADASGGIPMVISPSYGYFESDPGGAVSIYSAALDLVF